MYISHLTSKEGYCILFTRCSLPLNLAIVLYSITSNTTFKIANLTMPQHFIADDTFCRAHNKPKSNELGVTPRSIDQRLLTKKINKVVKLSNCQRIAKFCATAIVDLNLYQLLFESVCIFSVDCSETWSDTVPTADCVTRLLIANGWMTLNASMIMSSDDQRAVLMSSINQFLNSSFHTIIELSQR